MTIRDMLNAGIAIEGTVQIREWEEDDCDILFYGNSYDIPEDCKDKEITYVFAINGIGLVIEVSKSN